MNKPSKDIHVLCDVLMVQKDVKVTLMCLFDYYVNAEVWSYQFEGNVYVFALCVNKLFQFNGVNTFFGSFLHTVTAGNGNICGIICAA